MKGAMMDNTHEMLGTITALSHRFGTVDYVLGGGGNTSAKDETTLWVKPSGTTLSGIGPDTFLPLVRSRIEPLYAADPPADPNAREAWVKEMMQAAVQEGTSGRPSVEAPLHNAFAARYVVHTHPTWVNGLTCSQKGAEACARLWPEALWIPYVDPGYTLCMHVRAAIQEYAAEHGCQPSIVMLENHGVFVAGDDPNFIIETYDRIMTDLENTYAKTDVATHFVPTSATVVTDLDRARLQTVLGEDASYIVAAMPFAPAEGPLTPDHIVYAKSYPYVGPMKKDRIRAFVDEYGYAPRVIATEEAVYGVARTAKAAGLALSFAQDGIRIMQLAEAFGGVKWMTDAARTFIENWEVESYRSKVST